MPYNEISIIHTDMGNFEEALKYKARYSEIKDTLFSEQTTEIASNIEAKFENEKKAKEIEILKKENEIQDLELARNRLMIIASIGGLVLAIIFIFHIRANKQREEKGNGFTARAE